MTPRRNRPLESRDSGPVILDGAWTTELQARGLPPGECPDIWNLIHPDRVAQAGHAYVAAGSRILLTNTFGANRIALVRHGLAGDAEAINRAGVEISRQAAGSAARVFASMGPSGTASGAVAPDALRAAFREQSRALAAGGADGIVIETMTDLAEAKLALAAAQETSLSVVVSLYFGEDTGDAWRLASGETAEQAATELAACGAFAVGTNCCHYAHAGLPGLCQRIRAASGLPVWIKPNAGLPQANADGTRLRYEVSPDAFTQSALTLAAAGATFIGGCCGISPRHIRAFAAAVA